MSRISVWPPWCADCGGRQWTVPASGERRTSASTLRVRNNYKLYFSALSGAQWVLMSGSVWHVWQCRQNKSSSRAVNLHFMSYILTSFFSSLTLFSQLALLSVICLFLSLAKLFLSWLSLICVSALRAYYRVSEAFRPQELCCCKLVLWVLRVLRASMCPQDWAQITFWLEIIWDLFYFKRSH